MRATKYIAAVSVCTTLLLPARAQKEEYTKTTSSIKSITLFLNGAQIKRSCTFQASNGTNLVKIAGLPYSIDAKSIKIEGQAGLTLVSINHRFNYLEEAPQNPYYVKLTKERDDLQLTIQRHRNDRAILDEELQLLSMNQDIKGENEILNSEKLLDYSEIYQDRLIDINIKKQDIDRKVNESNKRLTALNKQISELEFKHNRSTSEILLNISSSVSKKITLEFSYSTYAARWVPFYDLRSDETNAPVTIELKAKVSQWTGEEWKDVLLTLSTGNPAENHELPKAGVWNLSVVNRQTVQSKSKGKKNYYYANGNEPSQQVVFSSAREKTLSELSTTTAATTMQRKEISTEYKIATPYSVPSDSRMYDVDISTLQNKASYCYFAAPRVARGAYLLARLPEWQKLNLLDGDANVYFKKTFIGKTHLESEIFSDTLDVSLGKDPNVVVDRQRVKAEGSTQIAGNTRTDTYIYEISVRNNKSTAIEIDIEDVIPISQDKEIIVKKLQDSDAVYDETKGIMTWHLSLAAGESKKIRFSYSVKYPKTRKVYGN